MYNIKLYKDRRAIPLVTRKYSAGEVYIAIDDSSSNISQECVLVANLRNSDDILAMFMLTDAIRNQWGDIEIRLVMPYIPYSRHDRVMQKGEPHALKVFCKMVNSYDYKEVCVYDPHSDVSTALLENVKEIPQELFVEELPLLPVNLTIVAPDAGAMKKAHKVARKCGIDQVIQAGKVRNLTTGEITNTVLYDTPVMANTDFLIVDDICDGGRTFIELAKELRRVSTGKISLYVTHGVFSKGFSELKKHIDHIYVVNSFTEISKCDTFVTEVNVRTNINPRVKR